MIWIAAWALLLRVVSILVLLPLFPEAWFAVDPLKPFCRPDTSEAGCLAYALPSPIDSPGFAFSQSSPGPEGCSFRETEESPKDTRSARRSRDGARRAA